MKKLLTSSIFMLVTAVWAGDFDDGMAASKRGESKTAFSLFKKAAEQENSTAQFNLGVMCDDGTGALQDYLQVHIWMNLAAVSGDKDAQKARDFIAVKMASQQIAKPKQRLKSVWQVSTRTVNDKGFNFDLRYSDAAFHKFEGTRKYLKSEVWELQSIQYCLKNDDFYHVVTPRSLLEIHKINCKRVSL